MMGLIGRFRHDERGYAIALTLIAMPLLLGFSLLVIDVSRGNNLHTDLQNAVDALALAGARELDGGTDAITRADAAIAGLVNNQTRLSSSGVLTIDETQIETPIYLMKIPGDAGTTGDDDTAIGEEFIEEWATSDGTEANYVLIRSNSQPMTSLFPVPVGWTQDTVNFQAEAVATYDASACDITPIFICNPFEKADGSGKSMEEAFGDGDTYSKEFRILKTEGTPGPGNFGLLDTEIALRTAFATGTAGACYNRRAVETKPGVTLGHVNAGLNVRFDIYSGSLKSFDNNPKYRPASNVRKGATKSSNCNKFESETDTSKAMGFPAGGTGEASWVSSSTWNRSLYWQVNHGSSTLPTITSSSHPTSLTAPPSRYDVYRYEIQNNLVADKGGTNKETGVPQCYKGATSDITADPDRRIIFGAVVNCLADGEKIAGRETLTPDAFVSMFLVAPIEKEDKTKDDESTAAEKPIRLEIVDITGFSGNGTLDTFLREESFLVR